MSSFTIKKTSISNSRSASTSSSSGDRYNNNRCSDPSSIISINQTTNRRQSPSPAAIVSKSKPTKNNQGNLSGLIKKFIMEKKKPKPSVDLVIATDTIVDDLKNKTSSRTTRTNGNGFGGLLHNKLLFGGNSSSKGKNSIENKNKKDKLLLTEVNANTRSLGMVLRSERELLCQNKEQQIEITDLKLMLYNKNAEIDKLKDLCLKQREEIKELKSAILFPDVMSTQSQGLLEKQNYELKEAKQIIPTLQRQVTSLTDQLQCLAEDLAEVKADKYSVMGSYDNLVKSSQRTPTYEQEEATNSLDFSSGDRSTPGSPDDMFLNDLNPCLTPYIKSKSKEFEAMEYHSPPYNNARSREIDFGFNGEKLSEGSTDKKHGYLGNSFGCRSGENKYTYGNHIHY
ncbi:uncharacterized protein [Rutidosis leptorrhynchoides]|uniref:uncharacterized protein n=1 Tax=Rutidosis leptorrhynchoides TaxID=125765 RepID=UPI003A9A0559